MANSWETVQKYTERYPDSRLLQVLKTAATSRSDWSIPKEWWDTLAEHESPETVAARAAAFMLAIDTKPERIDPTLETLDELQPGTNVLTPYWQYPRQWGDIGDRQFVVPYLSGVLELGPQLMPAEHVSRLGVGMLFKSEDTWGIASLPLHPHVKTNPDEIEAFYAGAASSEAAEAMLWPGRNYRVGKGLLDLIDTMARFDIEFDDPRITALHKAVRDKLSGYIVPSCTILTRNGRIYDAAALEDLPVLHRLDPQLSEERVREYAMLGIGENAGEKPDYWVFEKQLVRALARIRSQEDGKRYDGMQGLRQEYYMASAAFELSKLRLEASE